MLAVTHSQLYLRRSAGLAAAVCAAVVALPAQARELTAPEQAAVVAAGAQARSGCYDLAYRDTNAYGQCLRDRLRAPGSTVWQQLGTAYFGFVGAMSYVRVGQFGADQIALEFLREFRARQRRLGIDDLSLCSTVEGNCQTRMAQARQLEAAPPKRVEMRMRCIGAVCRLAPVE